MSEPYRPRMDGLVSYRSSCQLLRIPKLLESLELKICPLLIFPHPWAGVDCAGRNDNVSSSSAPSRSRREEILMENKVRNVDTNLADSAAQCFTLTSSATLMMRGCQGLNYFLEVFREFELMSRVNVWVDLASLYWADWEDSPYYLPGTLSPLLSLFFTLNINEGKHCSDLANNQLTLTQLRYIGGKWKVHQCDPLMFPV